MTAHSFSSFVALRYSIPDLRTGMSGFLSVVSLLGLSLGVFALIVVNSVMNGFERELQNRMLSILPHAQIIMPLVSIPAHTKASSAAMSISSVPISSMSAQNISMTKLPSVVPLWQALIEPLEIQPGIIGVAPYIESTVMLSANQRFYSAQMIGIDTEAEKKVSVLPKHIIAGDIARLKDTRYGIVLGSILARQLGLIPGDIVNLITPRIKLTPLGPVTRQKRFEVVAVFEVGAEPDQNMVLINLVTSQKLLAKANTVTGLRLSVSDQYKAKKITQSALSAALNSNDISGNPLLALLEVVDWRENNQSLYRAILMEKIMIFILLMSVVAVASFNVVSILLMTVTDKRSDIAVLRTMGASSIQIRRVFILQGLIISVTGTLIGAVLGILVAPNIGLILQLIEQLSGWQLFDPQVYYIPFLPSELRWPNVGIVVVVAIIISLLATLYPASKAAKIAPAEALAYEN